MPPKRPKPDGETNEVGGAGRDRTDDLLLAKQALSQLSYGPANASVGVGLAINLDGRDTRAASAPFNWVVDLRIEKQNVPRFP